MANMDTEAQARQRTAIRKKPFAVPPVKVACLSCRSSRIRCDGKDPCSGCRHRGKQCTYVQSRRGGARVPRSKMQGHEEADYVKIAQDCFNDEVPTMIKPGAGLTQLDLGLDNTDSLFDSIFTTCVRQPGIDIPRQTGSVRRYHSDDDLLSAYYIWVHPFFPILPPAGDRHVKDNPQLWFPNSSGAMFESRSPLGLAISVIMALIPHAEEGAPHDEESIRARRQAAHFFVKRTLETIENDSELPDSAISPAQALVHGQVSLSRAAFDARVPIELERVAALSILSVYEYAQRGNIPKMRDRASQALVTAMNLSLHDRGTEVDMFAEAKRRVWWMTYICACQASIVSSAPPAIPLFDSRFTTSYPQAYDAEAWPFFIKSQQTILLATQFVSAVDRAVKGKEDWQDISARMQELHNTIEPLIAQSSTWPNMTLPVINDAEATVSHSLKQMSKIKLNSARIKLHRYCAFFDIPVFSEKHCDLQKSEPLMSTNGDMFDQMCLENSSPAAAAACGGCSSSLPTKLPSLTNSVSPSNTASTTSPSSSSPDYLYPFPFSGHESSRLCLNSALNIAEAFERLPLPLLDEPQQQQQQCPRTMPSFACCAMQSAYALLMIYHRTWVQQGESPVAAGQLLEKCEAGLKSILTVLGNYSIAFEALGGMRDQIQVALDCLALA